VVAEGHVSHGHNEDSSDDEKFITPPSLPAAKRVSLPQSVVQSPDSQILRRMCNIVIPCYFYFTSGEVTGW
jgi:hypothetical protein